MRYLLILALIGIGLGGLSWKCTDLKLSKPVGGVNWKQRSSSNLDDALPFRDLYFFTPTIGIGLTGVSIKQTADGGANWKTSVDLGLVGLYGLAHRSGELWAAGSDESNRPLLLRTLDKGNSWQRLDIDDLELAKLDGRFSILYDLCFDSEGSGWVAGDGGLFQVSPTGNSLTINTVLQSPNALLGIDCSESGDVAAAGEKGIVLSVPNSSIPTSTGGNDRLEGVRIHNSEILVWGTTGPPNASVSQGIFKSSRDGGTTWRDNTPRSAGALHDLAFDGSSLWLVGSGGSIFRSSDPGYSWQRESSPVGTDFRTIFFLDGAHGWIGGVNSTVLATHAD